MKTPTDYRMWLAVSAGSFVTLAAGWVLLSWEPPRGDIGPLMPDLVGLAACVLIGWFVRAVVVDCGV